MLTIHKDKNLRKKLLKKWGMQCWHFKSDSYSDMEQQISQGYLLAFIFVFYPGGGPYKNIQHVKGRRR